MYLWHWHPIFVHFTAGLLFTSMILFVIAKLAHAKSWGPRAMLLAKGNFWLGLASAVLTVITGFLAYFTVPHADDALHQEMNRHMAFALGTVVLYLSLAVGLWRKESENADELPTFGPSGAWVAGLVVATALLTTTAYLGGSLVFQHGLGVTESDATTQAMIAVPHFH